METLLEIKKTESMHIETIDIGKNSGFDSKIIRFFIGIILVATDKMVPVLVRETESPKNISIIV